MLRFWHAIKSGYIRLIEPVVGWFIRHRVPPNVITTLGASWACAAGVLFATGQIAVAGWTLGLTAFFDMVDGAVARRTGTSTVFGAFYDSTLDRLADGVLFGGLAFFYASGTSHDSRTMVVVAMTGLLATFLTSYTRARAETLGIEMRGVGMMERPERIALLAAPQAFFGLSFDGWILRLVVTLLAVTAVITFIQRVRHVARTTAAAPAA
jgi:CDP-diacylglycerol--glycerol-3-phosphate 3-phosphatidyltransferase